MTTKPIFMNRDTVITPERVYIARPVFAPVSTITTVNNIPVSLIYLPPTDGMNDAYLVTTGQKEIDTATLEKLNYSVAGTDLYYSATDNDLHAAIQHYGKADDSFEFFASLLCGVEAEAVTLPQMVTTIVKAPSADLLRAAVDPVRPVEHVKVEYSIENTPATSRNTPHVDPKSATWVASPVKKQAESLAMGAQAIAREATEPLAEVQAGIDAMQQEAAKLAENVLNNDPVQIAGKVLDKVLEEARANPASEAASEPTSKRGQTDVFVAADDAGYVNVPEQNAPAADKEKTDTVWLSEVYVKVKAENDSAAEAESKPTETFTLAEGIEQPASTPTPEQYQAVVEADQQDKASAELLAANAASPVDETLRLEQLMESAGVLIDPSDNGKSITVDRFNVATSNWREAVKVADSYFDRVNALVHENGFELHSGSAQLEYTVNRSGVSDPYTVHINGVVPNLMPLYSDIGRVFVAILDALQK